MSGRFREYDATRPATMPAPSSTTNIAMSPMMRNTRRVPGCPGARLRERAFARGRAALRATCRSRKHAVNEPARILGGKLLRQLDRLVDHDRSRRFGAMAQFEHAHAQHDAIDRRQTLERPAFEQRPDQRIALLGK